MDDPESSQQGANAQPSLAVVLAAALSRQQNDSELLCRLVDITSHMAGHGGNRNNNQPRQCTYLDFMGTHPPTIERAREPLDADHWLRQTESMFGLLDCTEHQKLLFAAQQLQGPAGAWWANPFHYPLGPVLSGMSFELPFELISYQPYFNTEEKKRYVFLRGMNAALKECLTWQTTGTYNDLVNAAIVQEGAMRQVEEDERKRKAPASASAAT
ncbi:hypothetical protein PR202_gb29189 [Eleusine coracana subsp. coracana]|uniref:Uncharacterized protein n=1 Tax=Eleusine coracana subsp. coracana TaxID=191504 RepID=A0AAV5FZ74_ELECO|nr:hypothetical protein PR202_gb29189 [Eleusine coracana subsp. coracana]